MGASQLTVPSRGEQTHKTVAAFHEAGHALAALREGRQVIAVSISSSLPGNGRCVGLRGPRNPYDPTHCKGSARAAWKTSVESVYSDIRILLAGPTAEARLLKKPLRSLGSISDYDRCIYRLQRLNWLHSFVTEFADIPPVKVEATFEAERRKVSNWLRRPDVWPRLGLIAFALIYKSTLSALDLNNVIGFASPNQAQMALRFSDDSPYSG